MSAFPVEAVLIENRINRLCVIPVYASWLCDMQPRASPSASCTSLDANVHITYIL